MPLNLSTAPTVEPVSVPELRAHLRFDSTAEDAMLSRLIGAARKKIELWEWRAHVTQTWQLKLDRFPPLGCGRDTQILLPKSPLQSVSSITYLDQDGDEQTLSSSVYRVGTSDRRPGWIRPDWGQSWPTTRPVAEAVTVTFVAGYGAAADVPEHTRQAILILAGILWASRLGDQSDMAIPPVIDALLDPCHDDRLLEFL